MSGFVRLDWDRSRAGLSPDTPRLLVLVGGQTVESFLDAAGVIPTVEVAEDRRISVGASGESVARPVNQLSFDGRPQVLGERVVGAVPDAAGGRATPASARRWVNRKAVY